MKNCLVQTLKGVVENDNLNRFGYFSMEVKEAASITGVNNALKLTFTEESTIYIKGNGYFTDETGVENYGKSDTFTSKTVYLSNGNYYIEVPKYKIEKLEMDGTGSTSALKTWSLNLNDLIYSKSLLSFNIGKNRISGDIGLLRNCVNIERLGISGTGISGNLCELVQDLIANGRDIVEYPTISNNYFNDLIAINTPSNEQVNIKVATRPVVTFVSNTKYTITATVVVSDVEQNVAYDYNKVGNNWVCSVSN